MSILCWRWSMCSTWPFSLSSFKSSPMLSVLLSVEELELLVIPYGHVFENHLHFLSLWLICPSTSSYYHQAMVPILRHIVITNFYLVLVVALSSKVFLLLYNTCSYLDGNSDFLLKPCRWLMTLIAIGQELMGTICHACKNKSNAHSTPGVMVGSGNNCQQTKYIPKILTCGIAHLVKIKVNLMGVRACRWKKANERKRYKQWQCLHQVLNTMFTTRLLYFYITINI
jgi:hypothetical protein